MFPLNSSYCGKNFMSIQVVLNVWEQFKVQNLDIFGLHWTLTACFFFIQCTFPINFLGKVAHTSLVFIVKNFISFQEVWVTMKQFSKRRFSYGCVFCNFFLTLQSHFANTMSPLSDISFDQCICMLVLKHFTV